MEKKLVIISDNKPKISLKKRISNYNGKNLAKEFKWDKPRGKEIW